MRGGISRVSLLQCFPACSGSEGKHRRVWAETHVISKVMQRQTQTKDRDKSQADTQTETAAQSHVDRHNDGTRQTHALKKTRWADRQVHTEAHTGTLHSQPCQTDC